MYNEIIKFQKTNKGTTKCNKITIKCDVGTAQYENETIKCEDLVTWYSRSPTNGYHTPKKKSQSTIELPVINMLEIVTN